MNTRIPSAVESPQGVGPSWFVAALPFAKLAILAGLAWAAAGCGTEATQIATTRQNLSNEAPSYSCPGDACPIGPSSNPTGPFDTTYPAVLSFDPPGGTVAQIPAQVSVQFTEAIVASSAAVSSEWSFVCAGAGSNTGVASVNFDTVSRLRVSLTVPSGLSPGTLCSLNLPSTIADADGNLITGTRSVSYVLPNAGGSAGGNDVTPPTGRLTSIADNNRLSGRVAIRAQANDVGSTLSGIDRVEIRFNSTLIAQDTIAPYDISLDTNLIPNGVWTLSLTVVDRAGNRAESVDFKQVTVSNLTFVGSPIVGGTGGNVFARNAASGENLAGLDVWGGNNIDRLRPIWAVAYGELAGRVERYDGWVGSQDGSQFPELRCPSTGDWRVAGLFGVADEEIRSIGLVCKDQANPSSPAREIGPVGRASSVVTQNGNLRPYKIVCPGDRFVVQLKGRAQDRVDQLELGCR